MKFFLHVINIIIKELILDRYSKQLHLYHTDFTFAWQSPRNFFILDILIKMYQFHNCFETEMHIKIGAFSGPYKQAIVMKHKEEKWREMNWE